MQWVPLFWFYLPVMPTLERDRGRFTHATNV